MNNLSKREKLLVIVGAILIILYPYYNLFLKPISQKIKIVNQSISDKKIEYNSIEKLKVSNVTNTKKVEGLKIKYDEAMKALPENERNPEISYSINTFATQNNISIVSVAFGQSANYSAISSTNNTSTATSNTTTNTKELDISIESSKPRLMFVPVTVSIGGDYLSTLNFINNIEGDSRLAEVVNISILSTQEQGKELQSSIVLNYYSTEGTNKNKPSYNIKDDNAGKTDLFK
ncbi:hypothetical protein [Clostridium lacusfryxellense]|uniref:hypothetical protein n=1 Tax=Clostridium lacusfryxellense TaxID=205328 RepID=UPI001C0AF39A|nr:hypothetical protein [Clostridium lacusfryxellense]MBU3110250.1 hypothetical protein [Clostridium lacusfryxellense]